MKTSELIKLLQEHDPDSRVCVALCDGESQFAVEIGNGETIVGEFASNDIFIAINQNEFM